MGNAATAVEIIAAAVAICLKVISSLKQAIGLKPIKLCLSNDRSNRSP